jgi:hypothetical protein
MSLLLRKACQPTLEEFKLDNFHVAINTDTKYLEIVSECGKPLLTISGITFTRLQPSGAEIEYAVELLTNYFSTHAAKITTYIKALHKFNAKPVFLRKTDKYLIVFTNNYVNGKTISTASGIIYTDGMCNCSFNIHNSQIFATLTDQSFDAFSRYKPSKQAFNDACKYIDAFIVYEAEKDKVEELLKELSVCNI